MTGWFDGPSTDRPSRRPFEQLIIELAKRNGVPTWPVTSTQGRGYENPPNLKDAEYR